MECQVGQGTSYTYCVGSTSGNSFTCYDSTGNQIMQDRTVGEIDCSGVVCYDNQGSLVGTCEANGKSHRHNVDETFSHKKDFGVVQSRNLSFHKL